VKSFESLPPQSAGMGSDDLSAMLMDDDDTVKTFFHLIRHPADIKEAILTVNAEEWPRLLGLIEEVDRQAEVISLLDEGDRETLLKLIPPEKLTPLLREMETDDAADWIGDLPTQELQQKALAGLEQSDREDVAGLLLWPEDSAGGIMQVERAQVSQMSTLSETIAKVRQLVDDDLEILSIWVVDAEERLVGVIPVVDLLMHKGQTLAQDIMVPPVATVKPLEDQEAVAQIFRKYDLISLPVVDENQKFLGRIMVDDVVDVITDEANEDALRMAGTSAEELLYRSQVLSVAKIRLPWLAINLMGSLVSAFMIYLFEPVIEKAIVIAAFVPVITAMCGNVGTQSATIFLRGMATGRLDVTDIPEIFSRELRIGAIMGLACGLLVGAFAYIFFPVGDSVDPAYLGVIVGLSMIAAMTVSAALGAIAPAGMKQVGIDPAVAAGPFVTTVNDIIGICIYMGTAIYFLDALTHG